MPLFFWILVLSRAGEFALLMHSCKVKIKKETQTSKISLVALYSLIPSSLVGVHCIYLYLNGILK